MNVNQLIQNRVLKYINANKIWNNIVGVSGNNRIALMQCNIYFALKN